MLPGVGDRFYGHDFRPFVILGLTTCVAVICCLLNSLRILRWRDLRPRLRLVLLAADLSFPACVALFVLLA